MNTENEREAERLAKKLHGGWRVDQTPFGPNPVIVFTLWEAQQLEKRLADDASGDATSVAARGLSERRAGG